MLARRPTRGAVAALWVGLLLVASPLVAQRAPATVAGVVVDSAGRPVRDAVVVIRAATVAIDSAGDANARTDSLGRFRLASVSPGAVVLMVHHAAFESIQAEATVAPAVTVSLRIALNPVDSAARALVAEPDEPMQPRTDAFANVDTTAIPANVIKGIVFAADGTPLAGAEVSTLRSERSVQTDPGGRFTLPRDPGSSTMVRVRRIGWQAAFRVVPEAAKTVEIQLEPAGQQLSKVTVRANRWSAQTLREIDRRHWLHGGVVIGPVEIENRNSLYASRLMEGRVGFSVQRNGVVTGRRGCPVSLIVNGFFVRGESVDDVVAGPEVVAIEAYSARSNVPAEFLALLPDDGECGALAIWTR